MAVKFGKLPSTRREEEVRPKKPFSTVLRLLIETGSIIFLFYSNLLMGEFTRANAGAGKTLAAALVDIFTAANFAIAVVTALVGYGIFEYLRKKL